MQNDLHNSSSKDYRKRKVISFNQRVFWISALFLFLFLAQLPTFALHNSRESLKYPSPPMQEKPSISYSLESRWIKEIDSRLASSPAIVDNQVIILHPSGKLEAFALASGHPRWQRGPFLGATLLGVGEQTILLESGNELVGLNSEDGRTQWTSHFHSPIMGWSKLDSNSFALLIDRSLYRIELADGSLIEIGPIKLPIKSSSPFAFDGKRYLAIVLNSKSLHLYDMRREKIKWSFQGGSKITLAPVLKDNTLYILSEDHFIYALKLKNGHQKYRKKMENKLRYPAAVSEASLIVSPFASKHLYLVELSTGSSQTLFTLESERYHFVDSPFFSRDYLIATYADFFSQSSFLIVFTVEEKQVEESEPLEGS